MKRLLLYIITLLVPFLGWSQSYFQFNVKVYDPSGELNQNISQIPAGISLAYFHELAPRFAIGGEAGVAMYTSDSYTVEMNNGDWAEIEEEDCFWTLHAAARYYPVVTPMMKPYMEGRIGMTTFFSSQIVVDSNVDMEDSFQFHGTAFNAALGGGFLTDVTYLFKKQPGNIWIDLGLNYHSGSKASYRNFKNLDAPASTLEDGTYRSLTDYIDYKVGVAFMLR